MHRPRHVYIHVPFCARRCTYCDFSIAVRRDVPWRAYADAVIREIEIRFPEAGAWPIDTLYFGGGTPSRLGASGVAYLTERLSRRWSFTDGVEVTLEANPDDVTPGAVADWRQAGINRLSIGAQSFDDRVLAWMHRTHDGAAIERAVDAARADGITNLSIDLIFSLPESLGRSWETDVARALAVAPSHLSLYGLTIEPHTPLGRSRARGDTVESPEERYEAEFLHAHAVLSAAGLEHYEVSNFALPGFRSRHNSSYWSGAPYVGLGPSAHEFVGDTRRWNEPAYAEWMNRVGSGRDPIAGGENLTIENQIAEAVYLGLRTTDGLELEPAEIPRVQPWIVAGWATIDRLDRLRLTAPGWLRLDTIAAALTLIRSRY